jgi:hypothetical protein
VITAALTSARSVYDRCWPRPCENVEEVRGEQTNASFLARKASD